jgi:DNA-binding transcriptional MerR regulator
MARHRDFDGKYYRSGVVRAVCGISARQLDYWIDRGIISPPHSPSREHDPKRDTRLFTLSDILQIRVVKSLRDQGISLQKIRTTLDVLRDKYRDGWHRAWLVVFNNEILFVNGSRGIESLAKKSKGQLVFPVVALGEAQDEVIQSLKNAPALNDEGRYADRRVNSA